MVNETNQKEHLKKFSGLGIINMKARTKEVNGRFAIENNNNSFELKFYFPL
jgi:signal transduction histidine kinase